MPDRFQVSAQKVCQLSLSTLETANSSENIENENVSGEKGNEHRENENEFEVIPFIVSRPVNLFSNLL